MEYDKPEALRKIAIAAQESAKMKIQDLIDNEHGHTHNIISVVLRNLAKSYGYRYANEIVEDLNLNELFGIPVCTE